MNICLGENLKRLRKAKDITQDELAEELGVSFQSVSKWERGDCFPDITMLPGIANYFGVSTDELLGMDNMRNQAKMKHIFKTVHEYEAKGKYDDAINLLRESIKIFPAYYSFHSELALALTHISGNSDNEKALKTEAIALSEKVLTNSTNEKVRSTTRANLVFLLYNVGEYQKAVDLAQTLPHIWESREFILPDLYEGEKQYLAIVKIITIAISLISSKIDNINNAKKYREETVGRITLGPSEPSIEEIPDMIKKILEYIS